ncbi:MAG TPA: DUF1987 domain-containing protein [Bacteroidales bacterium]|nr:DUF1987 domain-containing protein [Bacteroidales bacterium]
MHIESYIKGPTRRTPGIVLSEGRILIMGRSIPENPGDFYTPVINWVNDFTQIYTGKIRIDLGFDYINTCSTKYIFLMLKQLVETEGIKQNISVTWYFEQDDDDMNDLGLILRSITECPFILKGTYMIDQGLYEKILLESERE